MLWAADAAETGRARDAHAEGTPDHAVRPRRRGAAPRELGRGARRRGRGVRPRARERTPSTSFGIFSCSKATNEMNFLAQKFARQVMGTNNIDSCNRT